MKIAFFNDVHGDRTAIECIKEKIQENDAKLAVCLGDLTIFENKLFFLLKKLNRFKINVIVMPGNHESDESLKKYCKKLNNVVYVNFGYYETDDFFMIFIDGNGFSKKDALFDSASKEIIKKYKESSKNIKLKFGKSKKLKLILATHVPPYNTKLDKIGKLYAGNQSIRNFILKMQPDYALCGHIHECEGKTQKLGKTIVINPGMYGAVLDI